MSEDNVIQFRSHPARGHTRWEQPILYATIYPNATILTDPTRDEVDKQVAAETLFDATFHVLADADQCVALISLGVERMQCFRQPDTFDTTERRRWLRRRLDDAYETLTGRQRTGSRLRAFLNRLFHKGHSS